MSTGGIESFFIPQLNPQALIQKNPRATTDWLVWAGMSGPMGGIQYKNLYEVTTLYAKILPPISIFEFQAQIHHRYGNSLSSIIR